MTQSCFTAFFLTAGYELLDGFYGGHLNAVNYLIPAHFLFLRSRMHFLRWETLLTASMLPNMSQAELAFFDQTFLNTPDPITILENNALLRGTLLRALQAVAVTHNNY